MVSRKRSKGKERKAKQAAKAEDGKRAEINDIWKSLARGVVRNDEIVTQCDHGLCLTIPDNEHPVSKFIDTFIGNYGLESIESNSQKNDPPPSNFSGS